MFDLQNKLLTDVKHAESPIPRVDLPATTGGAAASKLDSEPMKRLHGDLLGHYTRELDRQGENRTDMAIDEDFYDNIQWTQEDRTTLTDRGQVPLVYNVISSTVDWVIGTEKRGRSDYKVLPRTKEDAKPAERKSQLLKYLSDINRSPFHRSRAFEDAVKVGVGWLEDGVQEEPGSEPLYSRYESWRNILWDSSARENDLVDARYQFRSKWVDADISAAMFANRKQVIEDAIDDGDRLFSFGEFGDDAMDQQENENEAATAHHSELRSQRGRVRNIEGWFTRPVRSLHLKGGAFNGEIFDPFSEGHVGTVNAGNAMIVDRPILRMHVALFTVSGLLWFSESPYRHNRFPFTPIWGYRRGRDGMPYGLIRRLRDLQVDINKRASKALHILNSSKVIMDEGAVDDIDEFVEEVSRPDAILIKKAGKELKLDVDRELSQFQYEAMSRSIQMVQTAGGVTDENLGRKTNATSGIAIQRRQEQGSMATTKLFDNLRFACQVQGEKQIALIEQFMTEQKAFRITNMRGTPEYHVANDGLPENQIDRCKSDYVISEADWRASIRQAQADELLALLGQLAPVAPQVAIVMLDLIVENMDIANREEIVKRIRQVTNMRDPDADEPTPEEIARDKEAAEMKQLQKMTLQAQLNKLVGDGQKSMAQAKEIAAKMVGDNVDAIASAIAAAQATISTPAAAPVGDFILHEAGFISRTEAERMAQRAAEMAAAKARQEAIAEGAAAGGGAAAPPTKLTTVVQGG